MRDIIARMRLEPLHRILAIALVGSGVQRTEPEDDALVISVSGVVTS